MEILQVLLSLFTGEKGGEFLSGIIKLFQENDFDIKKVLSNLNLSALLPLVMKAFENQKNSPTDTVGHGYGLNPITNIADKEIIYTLGRYFHQPLS